MKVKQYPNERKCLIFYLAMKELFCAKTRKTKIGKNFLQCKLFQIFRCHESDDWKIVSSFFRIVNSLSTSATKISNTLKRFVSWLPRNCLIVFDRFVALAFKGLEGISVIGFWDISSSNISWESVGDWISIAKQPFTEVKKWSNSL